MNGRPLSGTQFYDETRADDDAYGRVLDGLRGRDLAALCESVQRRVGEEGVHFQSPDGASEFRVDAVPRIFSMAEWSSLEQGLIQRVQALERFVADVYAEQEIVQAGVIPVGAVVSASYYEPQLAGATPQRWVTIAGLDVVRDSDGTLQVLEDNLRTPSGLAYALAVRRAVADRVAVPDGRSLVSLSGVPALLSEAIRAAAPVDEAPAAVLLTDGPANSAFYEHAELAELAGLELVRVQQLEQHEARLWMRDEGRRVPVNVVYRRTDADRMFGPDGRLTELGEVLHEPWRRGRLGLVNAFGTGVADDKLMHGYVEDMVRFYLGQEPLLPSVATYDLSRPPMLEMVLDRLRELVIKPRDGHGGQGVVIGAHCDAGEIEDVRTYVRADPAGFVAQEMVGLSRHPTIREGALSPRHIDLRPFVMAIGDRLEVVPGGLTRVAFDAGSLIVNSSQNGGAKDTWVLT